MEHYARVWRFLRRIGVPLNRVDDAAQQVFLMALNAMARIPPGSERAFLYATAFRTEFGLRREREREIGGFDLDLSASALRAPENLTDQKKPLEVLDGILDRMDIDLRTVLVLFEIDGFTVSEIAKVLSIPIGTAASRLRRSREHFHTLVRLYEDG
jgi:RNA polymerase sigma-70 factor, ECF subfamily